MLKNVRIAIGVALLLLAGFAGYQLGAWRLGKAQAEIAQLKQAGDAARASAQAAQSQVDAQLKTLSTEQAAKEKALTVQFQADRQKLDQLLGDTSSRATQLESKRVDAERKRAQLQQELDDMRQRPGARPAAGTDPAAPNAPPLPPDAARSALEAEAARQAAEIQRLTAQIAGLKCEDAVVPDEEVAALNRAARADAAGVPQ
jgi:hypothetical protein